MIEEIITNQAAIVITMLVMLNKIADKIESAHEDIKFIRDVQSGHKKIF